MIGNAAKWKEDSLKIETGNKELIAKKTEKKEDYFEVKFTWNSEVKNMLDALQVFGHIPIPPYFKRSTEAIDVIRYQNVFAHHDGSVAAPTAGLHFTKPLINQLEQNNVKIDYVTLHVGAGTFKPVKSETLGGHQMHREKMFLTKNLIHDLLRNTSDKKITAVGTTTLRTLESLFWMGQIIYNSPEIEEEKLVVPQWFPYEQQSVLKPIQSLQSILDWMTRNKTDTFAFSTELLILPSYQFKIAEALITNFHQPNSTLLLLVAAATNNKWQELYDHALQNDYRFLSYGDSSYIKF
jgi:S-adenosylmethionine:tRNA ribosyltransferase-isomerase